MQTLTEFLESSKSLDNPGIYEIYELEELDDITRRFVIKNMINNRAVLVTSKQNKIEIDNNYKIYGNIGGKKISFMRFFERLKGLGVTYKN